LAVKYFKLLLVLSSALQITISAANNHTKGICQLCQSLKAVETLFLEGAAGIGWTA
jgi:hypothetical protein